MIDVVVPADCRVNSKESEKMEKYLDLKSEVNDVGNTKSGDDTVYRWSFAGSNP